jgi:hypothetical protein
LDGKLFHGDEVFVFFDANINEFLKCEYEDQEKLREKLLSYLSNIINTK